MKIIVIGSRAYNELVGRIEKIEAAIASLPEKGRAWNKEYINDEWMDGEQVCRYLGISGRTLQRLRSDHVITYSAINRKLYYSLTEIRRVLKERSVRRKNRPKEYAMFLDKEYFDGWMQRLSERLERIEKLCAGDVEQPLSILPDGERLLDNYDLCRMLNISKRTLQRYRTSGELPYEMIYHKTFYRESDVLRFIERNFSNFRKLKKDRPAGSG